MNILNLSEAQQAVPQSPKGGKKGGKGKSKSPKGGKSPDKGSPKASAKPASPKGKKGGKKGSKPTTPASEPQPVQPAQPKPVEIVPGSDEWIYVKEKIDPIMAKVLCEQWDLIENYYMSNSKFVFRKIRNEREQIIRYFFNIKSTFKEYLQRPDTKQEVVDMFVKAYNSLPEDMRDDEEVKAELHQRVEDLKEKLWKICDDKKADSERELELVKSNNWVSDKTGLLINHYISLMQAEFDRFQDTSRMLKDYYKCMQSPQPEEMPKEFPRLPLVEVSNTLDYIFLIK